MTGEAQSELNGTDTPPWLVRHWWIGVFFAWLGFAILMLAINYSAIDALPLRDTDDNLRLAQVRALLGGQGWFDLTQYRLAPPAGADIHWSRIPDLPIAGLILLLSPMIGAAAAEQWAVALAPLLPLAIGATAVALIARRLIDPAAWALGLLVMLGATIVLPMWMPFRIDHHGWQLSLLAIALAGLVDPRRLRGGLTSGAATGLSLAIGLEMLVFLALIGGVTAMFWVHDGAQRRRIAGYGASLAGTGALGFLLFASDANRAPVCDALSPVWLSAIAAAGGALVLLALLPAERRAWRFGLAGVAAVVLAAGFAIAWPDCLARPEGVGPELQSIWLDNVKEARPIARTPWRSVLLMLALPLSGLVGYGIALKARYGSAAFAPWLGAALLALVALLLLFWQVRLGTAAQLLALPGATLLAWHWLPAVRGSPRLGTRVVGTVALLLLATGIYMVFIVAAVPKAPDPERKSADRCMERYTLEGLDSLPPSLFLTQVDLAPRLIVTTHHSALAGPYHRNEAAMLDDFHAFRDAPEDARPIIERRGIDYVLLCPTMSGAQVYIGDTDTGLYSRLVAGETPDWLEPVPIDRKSGLRLWRVR